MIMARPQQQQIEPAYLRDYYAQIAQQNAQRGSVADATPIFEQNTSFQPSQHATVGQQIRVRDPVQDQVRTFFIFNIFISFFNYFHFKIEMKHQHPLHRFQVNKLLCFIHIHLHTDSCSATTIHSSNCKTIQSAATGWFSYFVALILSLFFAFTHLLYDV